MIEEKKKDQQSLLCPQQGGSLVEHSKQLRDIYKILCRKFQSGAIISSKILLIYLR